MPLFNVLHTIPLPSLTYSCSISLSFPSPSLNSQRYDYLHSSDLISSESPQVSCICTTAAPNTGASEWEESKSREKKREPERLSFFKKGRESGRGTKRCRGRRDEHNRQAEKKNRMNGSKKKVVLIQRDSKGMWQKELNQVDGAAFRRLAGASLVVLCMSAPKCLHSAVEFCWWAH